MSDELDRRRDRAYQAIDLLPETHREDVEFVLDESIALEMRLEESRKALHVVQTELHTLRQRYAAMEGELAGVRHDLGRLVEECEQARRFEQMVGRLDGRLE